ncbi:hypothetical protein GCM10007147_04470 [Nocardiopsis kunsanensis]|uniref:Uncharacterized protein n=1 Tax=Nocardiopsis kunsanensis TaxID=141693 RepID=A0A919CF05_9ACTN|nr:hypothetical protein GCM10007147_04470 [Nocardiopsis kunsanensis]
MLEEATTGARTRARAVADGTATAGRELRWAAELSARTTTARIDHVRPEPLGDRRLLGLMTVIAVAALVVALVLGIGVAGWLMTAENSMVFAAVGSLAVGFAVLSMAYLVFASRRRRHP